MNQIIKILLEFIFNSIFIKMAIQDWRTYQINKIDLRVMLFIVVIEKLVIKNVYEPKMMFFLIICLIIWSFIWYFNQEKLGLGDLKIFGILTIKYGILVIPIVLISSGLGLIVGLIFQKNKIPFVPFIYGGVLCLDMLIFLSS